MSAPGAEPEPARPPLVVRIFPALAVAVALALLVSVSVSTWRTVFPRPAAPTYVCVYISAQETTTVTGSDPCRGSGAK